VVLDRKRIIPTKRLPLVGEVSLERGPLSLVRIIEELFEGNSGSGLENRVNGRGELLDWSRDTLYPLNLALIWNIYE
jgi:hypothetical protein